MDYEGIQTRRAFLGRALAFGAVLATGAGPLAAPASAKRRKPLPWSTPRNVTGDLANPLYAVAADGSGLRTYLVKCDGSGAIQFAQSSDEGRTFSAFSRIAGISNASDVPLDRPFVVDEVTKRIHLVFSVDVDDASGPAKLLYIHSDDGGRSWSHPVVIDDGVASTGLNHGTNRFIRVAMAAQHGFVHIGWASISNKTFLTDGLFYVKSTNGGDSFSRPKQPFPGAVSPSRPDIALIGKTVLMTWTDARHGSAYNGNPGETFVGRSTDGGRTWKQKQLTFTARKWGAGMTLRPVICAGPHGMATIVWQAPDTAPVAGAGGVTDHASPGNEDLHWIHSSNAGASWGNIGLLIRAPHEQNHAYLAQHKNLVACAWGDRRYSPSQLRVKLSTNGGKTFGTVMQPMVANADAIAPRIIASRNFFQAYAAEGGAGVFRTRVSYRSIKAATR